MTRPSMALICAHIVAEWPNEPGGEPVTVREVRGPSQARRAVRPRQTFYAAARAAGYSYPRIAKFCGKLDHTTVIYGARRHAEREGALAL